MLIKNLKKELIFDTVTGKLRNVCVWNLGVWIYLFTVFSKKYKYRPSIPDENLASELRCTAGGYTDFLKLSVQRNIKYLDIF